MLPRNLGLITLFLFGISAFHGVFADLATALFDVGLFMLLEDLVLATLANLVENDDWLENISEWHFATALAFYLVLTWHMWQCTGFTISFHSRDR
ncbi:MAG: hypothetical protein QF921_09615 [Pseudomonadales bacterium]|jgi:hypothetical protein|nr:hypothetical protein [Pseudomonadales bacterium]MDP6827157.1 hypothetical protein [Pseudomonadales bacterium]MDP6971751.1 hypothetical protein [Pseudomonadales bacterium]|tara:strand:- start:1193 stop:1477 length:285 start_codon:yes stop_codon:yes gene_type:complete